jgi:type I restriction enzyme S subunit
VRLKYVVSLLGDGIHGTPEYDDMGKYYFINGNNLSKNKIVLKDDTKKVNEAEYQKYKKELTEKTILVSINGTIGNVGHYNDEPVILGKSACYFNLIDVKLKEYVTLLMYTDFFLQYAKENATGSTIKNVSLAVMNSFVFPLPPLSEQKRIVTEIERWFTLIDELESNEGDLLKAIDKAKSKILDLAIHGKLVPQDPNDEPAIDLLKRINPKFEPFDNPHYTNVKRGWCLAKLEDVIELLDNKRIPVKSEEREQRIKNKEKLYPYYGATGFVGYIDNYILDGHYILLGEDGAPFEDKHANVAYEVKGKIWVNNHAHILFPKISFEYLLHSLNAVDYTLYAKGTTRLKLTQKDMLNIPILVPPYQEQLRIVTKIEELFAVLDGIKESLES